MEFPRLGVRGARHARQLFVETEVVLERDRRERLVLTLDPDAFLRLDRLVEAVRPSPPGQHAPGELVDDQDLAVLQHVIDVLLVEGVRAQGLLGPVEQVDTGQLVEVLDAQQLFGLGDAFLG